MIVVDRADKVTKLISTAAKTPTLKHIVIIFEDTLTEDLKAKAAEVNLQLHKFNDLLEIGENHVQQDSEPTPADTFLIW